MPFKRNIMHSDGLNFWQCICSGVIKLIRLAWNGAAVISDLSVLCGDSSALRSGRPSFSLSTCSNEIGSDGVVGRILSFNETCLIGQSEIWLVRLFRRDCSAGKAAHVDESIPGLIGVVPVSGENLMKSHQF